VRNAVHEALKAISYNLNLLTCVPSTGLVICSGDFKLSKQDALQVKIESKYTHIFNPPQPVTHFFYRCDRHFHLQDLIPLYKSVKEEYAILLVSGKDTRFYLYNSNVVVCLSKLKETLPNNHNKGGQSSNRFARIRESVVGHYIKRITEIMKNLYVKEGIFSYSGLIIAGPAETKNLVYDDETFKQFFQKHTLKFLNIPQITETSIYCVIKSSLDVLSNLETDIFSNLEEKIVRDVDSFIFGEDAVISAFKQNLLKTIYVSSTFTNKILENKTKTNILVVSCKEFISKYGIVGEKHFSFEEFAETQ